MWSIDLLKNTVEVSEACADEIYKGHGDTFYERSEVTYKGKLYFNPDHMEHMDYVGDKRIQRVLKKHKVSGDITFGSLDGDNAGQFWGYRFDGKGGMKRLVGEVVFKEQSSGSSDR